MHLPLVRPQLWRTRLIRIIGLLVFFSIGEVIFAVAWPPLSGPVLLLTGVAVAVLGALSADAVGQPLLAAGFHPTSWIGWAPMPRFLGLSLVTSFMYRFLIYTAAHYSICYFKRVRPAH